MQFKQSNHMKDEKDGPASSGLVLGIDMGGTHTAYAVVGDKGDIIARGSLDTTASPTFDRFIDDLYDSVVETLKTVNLDIKDLRAIGVGAPCVNHSSGVIEGAVDLPWPSPLPLTYKLSNRFNIPAAADNDANAAALGEMYYGVCRNVENFIMITLGTGVGSAIVCDGRLLHGKRGLAGELGHTLIRRDSGRPCSCGRYGCLETYASARGVARTAREYLETLNAPSPLRDLKEITAKDVGEAADKGDLIASETFRYTGKILGDACADFAAFSSPEAIVFFGGVAHSFRHFEPAMREAFQRNLLWIYNNQIRFFQSGLPEADAALLGAAAVGRALIS